MKDEFNFWSLAKALANDVVTSPARVHEMFKETLKVYYRAEEGPVSGFMGHTGALVHQGACLALGAEAGALITILATLGTVRAEVGFIGGAVLLNPLIAKMAVNYLAWAGKGIDRKFEKQGLTRPPREFPEYEAYPEFSKALEKMQPQ